MLVGPGVPPGVPTGSFPGDAALHAEAFRERQVVFGDPLQRRLGGFAAGRVLVGDRVDDRRDVLLLGGVGGQELFDLRLLSGRPRQGLELRLGRLRESEDLFGDRGEGGAGARGGNRLEPFLASLQRLLRARQFAADTLRPGDELRLRARRSSRRRARGVGARGAAPGAGEGRKDRKQAECGCGSMRDRPMFPQSASGTLAAPRGRRTRVSRRARTAASAPERP